MTKIKVNLQGKYQEFIPHLDDIIAYLKERLAEAREQKDADISTKLLDQLWTMTDFKKGVLTNVKEKHLEEVFSLFKQNNLNRQAACTKTASKTVSDDEKKLKQLIKKRDQIRVLVERQKRGEKLENNQLDKIKNLEKLEKEIEKLEEIIN